MKKNALKEFVSLRINLEQERSQLQTRLNELNEALGINATEAGAPSSKSEAGRQSGKRFMSAAARARIAAAQRARWAKVKGTGGAAAPVLKSTRSGKRTMSAEAKARIAEAQRRRWARIRAGK
jgi:hypothetical protein